MSFAIIHRTIYEAKFLVSLLQIKPILEMRIFLLLNQPYPNGYALSKRFHLYAKGLTENKQEVIILIPKPTDIINKPLNKSTNGFHNFIN